MNTSPLQAFKARCVVGAQCLFTAHWCPAPTLRTVTIVQSRKVAFTHPTRASNSWLDFPKASQIQQPEPGLFVVTAEFGGPLTYDFNQPARAAATPESDGVK